jgi:Ca2+-binding EF-hand superfamily protein
VSNGGSIEEYTLRKTFSKFDRNGNGVISREELEGLLCHFGIRLISKELTAVFRHLDLNNSGVLEFEEF